MTRRVRVPRVATLHRSVLQSTLHVYHSTSPPRRSPTHHSTLSTAHAASHPLAASPGPLHCHTSTATHTPSFTPLPLISSLSSSPFFLPPLSFPSTLSLSLSVLVSAMAAALS